MPVTIDLAARDFCGFRKRKKKVSIEERQERGHRKVANQQPPQREKTELTERDRGRVSCNRNRNESLNVYRVVELPTLSSAH